MTLPSEKVTDYCKKILALDSKIGLLERLLVQTNINDKKRWYDTFT
jgi:hypothetical protein